MIAALFHEDTTLVFVDTNCGGWWDAHEGRNLPSEQFVNAWRLDRGSQRYWILEFPSMRGGEGGLPGRERQDRVHGAQPRWLSHQAHPARRLRADYSGEPLFTW
jgi:hypothetical protein